MASDLMFTNAPGGRGLQFVLKIDSPGKVECLEMLEASTIDASMSFNVGAPMRRRFISNSSCTH